MTVPAPLVEYIRLMYDFSDNGEILDPMEVVHIEASGPSRYEILWIGGYEEVRLDGNRVVQISCDRL